MDAVNVQGWEHLQPGVLMAGWRQWLAQSEVAMMTLAALVLMVGLGMRLYRVRKAGRDTLRVWYRVVLLSAVVLSLGPLLRLVLQDIDDAWRALPGQEPAGLARRFFRLAAWQTAPDRRAVTRADALPQGEEGQRGIGWGDLAEEYFEEEADQEEEALALDGAAPSDHDEAVLVRLEQQSLALGFSYLVTVASFMTAAVVAWAGEVVRYLILHLGQWAAPLLVAALAWESLVERAKRAFATLGVLVVCPFLWKLGHLITVPLVDLWLRRWNPGDHEVTWANLDQAFLDQTPQPAFLAAGISVPHEWLLLTALGAVGLLVWVLMVVVGGPWCLWRVVVTSPSAPSCPSSIQ